MPTPSIAGEATSITQPLQGICGSFKVLPIEVEPEPGWPIGPNQHFAAAVNNLSKLGIDEPFLWMEPDCTPRKFDWANDLITEYHQEGKPYMGVQRLTSEVSRPPLDGKHMIGCGIYPADFPTRTRLWAYAAARRDQPFDVFMRHETVGDPGNSKTCHATKLIQHCPRSAGYHPVDEGSLNGPRIRGKSTEADGVTFEVNREAVLVHGIKDGSLARYLVTGKADKVKTQVKEEFVPSVEIPVVTEKSLDGSPAAPIWQAIKDWIIQIPGASKNAVVATPGHAVYLYQQLVNEVQPDVPPELVEEIVALPEVSAKVGRRKSNPS